MKYALNGRLAHSTREKWQQRQAPFHDVWTQANLTVIVLCSSRQIFARMKLIIQRNLNFLAREAVCGAASCMHARERLVGCIVRARGNFLHNFRNRVHRTCSNGAIAMGMCHFMLIFRSYHGCKSCRLVGSLCNCEDCRKQPSGKTVEPFTGLAKGGFTSRELTQFLRNLAAKHARIGLDERI